MKNNIFPRACTRCDKVLGEDGFYSKLVKGHRYFSSYCKECNADYGKIRAIKNPPTAEQKRKKYAQSNELRLAAKAQGLCPSCLTAPRSETSKHCERCRERINQLRIERVAGFKKQIFDHYGHRCACPGCNVTLEEFLTIDHVGGWGKNHRDEKGFRIGGERLYREIIKAGFPDTFRILCFNCNCSQAFRGYCPHEVAALVQ